MGDVFKSFCFCHLGLEKARLLSENQTFGKEMKFRQYQKYASKTLQKSYTDVFFALGLGAKVGYVCDLIKQQKMDSVDLTEQIRETLGDVLWHLTGLCEQYGGLEEIATDSLEIMADICEAGQSKVSDN